MKLKIAIPFIGSALAVSSVFGAVVSLTPTNFPTEIALTGSDPDVYEITADLTLTAADEYIIEAATFVTNGATLTIEADTIVRGQPLYTPVGNTNANTSALVITQDGFIEANGTPSQPIIFTTAADTNRTEWTAGDTFLDATPDTAPLAPTTGAVPNTGLWGGVILLGEAPTNLDGSLASPANLSVPVGNIEGLPQDSRTIYGGLNPNDTSGSMSFVSIRHNGIEISAGNELQGLTLGGVGLGTDLNNVEVYCSADDGIEIFGGTVAIKNFMISYADDDSLDMDQGYAGLLQFGFIVQDETDVVGGDHGFEWDGDDFDENPSNVSLTGLPLCYPTIYNMTLFGDRTDGANDDALRIRNGGGGNLFNSIVAYYPSNITNLAIDNPGAGNAGFEDSGDRVGSGTLNLAGVVFYEVSGNTAATISTNTIGEDVINNNTTNAPGASLNQVIASGAGTDPFFGFFVGGNGNDRTIGGNALNPAPVNGAAFGAANSVAVTSTFFTDVSFVGAFEPGNPNGLLFTTGWTAMNIAGTLVDAASGAVIVP